MMANVGGRRDTVLEFCSTDSTDELYFAMSTGCRPVVTLDSAVAIGSTTGQVCSTPVYSAVHIDAQRQMHKRVGSTVTLYLLTHSSGDLTNEHDDKMRDHCCHL